MLLFQELPFATFVACWSVKHFSYCRPDRQYFWFLPATLLCWRRSQCFLWSLTIYWSSTCNNMSRCSGISKVSWLNINVIKFFSFSSMHLKSLQVRKIRNLRKWLVNWSVIKTLIVSEWSEAKKWLIGIWVIYSLLGNNSRNWRFIFVSDWISLLLFLCHRLRNWGMSSKLTEKWAKSWSTVMPCRGNATFSINPKLDHSLELAANWAIVDFLLE